VGSSNGDGGWQRKCGLSRKRSGADFLILVWLRLGNGGAAPVNDLIATGVEAKPQAVNVNLIFTGRIVRQANRKLIGDDPPRLFRTALWLDFDIWHKQWIKVHVPLLM
jgi:hypothetical protein